MSNGLRVASEIVLRLAIYAKTWTANLEGRFDLGGLHQPQCIRPSPKLPIQFSRFALRDTGRMRAEGAF